MKKIFAFAAAIVAMASVMTSCGNDNLDYIEQKVPTVTEQEQQSQPAKSVAQDNKENDAESTKSEKTFDGKIFFTASQSQLEYFNNIYNVTVGDETVEVNVAELPIAPEIPGCMVMKIRGFEALYVLTGNDYDPAVVYQYTIPEGKKGDVSVTANISVKEGVTAVEDALLWYGAGCNMDCDNVKLERVTKYNQYNEVLPTINGVNYLTQTLK